AFMFARSRPIFLYIEPCQVCRTVWNDRFLKRARSHSFVTIQRELLRASHQATDPTTTGIAPSGTTIDRSSTAQYRLRSGWRVAISRSIARGLQVALRPKKLSKNTEFCGSTDRAK